METTDIPPAGGKRDGIGCNYTLLNGCLTSMHLQCFNMQCSTQGAALYCPDLEGSVLLSNKPKIYCFQRYVLTGKEVFRNARLFLKDRCEGVLWCLENKMQSENGCLQTAWGRRMYQDSDGLPLVLMPSVRTAATARKMPAKVMALAGFAPRKVL